MKDISELYPNLKHELIYNMYSCKITWCETCKNHHYDGFKENDKVYHVKTNFRYSDFPKPKTNIEEILLHLIVNKTVSIMDYSYMSGFRTRVSNIILKYGVFLEREFKTKINQHGNSYSYAIHTLPDSEKQKAVNIYYQLNNQ